MFTNARRCIYAIYTKISLSDCEINTILYIERNPAKYCLAIAFSREMWYIKRNTSRKGVSRVLRFKFDVLKELKDKGYTTYKMQKENILGNATVQNLRNNQMVGITSIDTICNLLHCQPGDLIEHIPD